METTGIYKIESKIKSNRIYIGSAVNIEKRKREHFYGLRNNKHFNKKLQNHFNKYGKSDLHFSILLGCEKTELIEKEQFFIDTYKPFFNLRPKANSQLGFKFSNESKEKLSNSHKGQIPWIKNRYHSITTRKKISDTQTGRKLSLNTIQKMHNRKHSEETKKKMSESQKKRIRKPLSEEHKKKLILANLGKKQSLETIEKRICKLRGIKRTDLVKEKISKKEKGKIVSDETRQKISIALIKYQLDKKTTYEKKIN